jgi:tRNA (guanine-N7-)-methyltransferase
MIEHEFGVAIPGEILPPARWTKTGVKRLPESGPLDWSAVFERSAPVVLDLGCGNGRFTLASALSHPEWDHFAIDLLPVVIRYATRRANQRGLQNVRFAVRDAQTFLARYVADGSIAQVHIYHPQPFHDRARAHLRLVTPAFLADVHRVLETGGRLFLQTDNPDYWSYIRQVAPVFFDFKTRDTPWPELGEGRSRRELLARGRGLAIYRGEGARRAGVSRIGALAEAERLPLPTFRTRGAWTELDAEEGGHATRRADASPRTRSRRRPHGQTRRPGAGPGSGPR